MQNKVRFAVAAAMLAASAGAAYAQTPSPDPSSNNADLWLFVADTTAQEAYAMDTGISINTLLPTASLAASTSSGSLAILSTAISAPFEMLAPDANLLAFLSDTAPGQHFGDTLEWGIEGTQYPTFEANHPVPGKEKGITANNLSPTFEANMFLGNLSTWATGWETDWAYMVNGVRLPSGGTQPGVVNTLTSVIFPFANGAPSDPNAAGNVWGAGEGVGVSGATDLYGQGANAVNAIGAGVTLYGLTGSGNTGQLQSYVLSTAVLWANGTFQIEGAPLPPAVWLLGSGLLGLAGVARWRAISARSEAAVSCTPRPRSQEPEARTAPVFGCT